MINANVVVLDKPNVIRFVEEKLDSKNIGPKDILCETLITAISPGTELAAYNGLPPLRPSTLYPRLQGYCNVSRVIDAGDQVTNIEIGDRVLTFESHRSHFITSSNKVLSKVPSDVLSDDAACTYLFHIGYDAVIRSPIRYGGSMVVIGLGVLGLTTVSAATRAGINVYAISNQTNLKLVADEFGAKKCFSRNDPLIDEKLDQELIDTVISTTNSWKDWRLCLKLVRPRGNIGVIGFPGRGELPPENNPLDSQYFYDKQLSIQCLGLAPEENDTRNHLRYNEKSNIKFLLDEIALKKIHPNKIVSGIFPWKEIEKAYTKINSREGSPITFLLKWND